jgi:ABC-type sugar transport system permease subunit
MSLHNWSLVKPVRPSSVWRTTQARRDPLFRLALYNTTLFAVVTVPVTLVLAFTVAVLLDRPMRDRRTRTVSFSCPVV